MRIMGISNKTTSRMAVALFAAAVVHAAPRPNVVWIFSDDHSFQAIGAYGSRLAKLNPTPNIDRLAREGMRFDRAYVANSLCGPSRATLLTGKFNHLCGKPDNSGSTFDTRQRQFQMILRAKGYQTALIGKIHLPGKMHGFDYWEVLPGQGQYENPNFLTERGKTKYEGYVSDVITDRAIRWLETDRDPKKPFMLMVHHKAPHRNWMPKAELMGLYAETEIPEPPTLFDDYSTRTESAHEAEMRVGADLLMEYDLKVGGKYADDPRFSRRNAYFESHRLEGKALTRWKYQIYMKDYLRCVRSVDESVGRIMRELNKLGLASNTIVMYSSDQGFFNGEHGWFDKRFMYEEAFRTPLIAWWPGHVPAGSVNDDLVQNVDFAETFLDLADAPIPADMQGRSLKPLLFGQTPADWRKSLYYHYYEYPLSHRVHRQEGVATRRYKLIRFYGDGLPEGGEWELYDLEKDPLETNNVCGNPEYAKTAGDLKQELARLRAKYKVPPDEEVFERFGSRRK